MAKRMTAATVAGVPRSKARLTRAQRALLRSLSRGIARRLVGFVIYRLLEQRVRDGLALPPGEA